MDDNPTITNDYPSDGFAVGEHAVTWSAVDRYGNTGSATQNVNITDTTSPTVVAPADVVLDATGLLTIVPTETLGTATATDSVDDTLTITSDYPSDGFAAGEHAVTWSAVDHSGNVGTATQTVTIQDNTAPEIVFATRSNVSVLLNGDFTYSGTSCMDDTKDGEFAATRSGDEVDTSTVGVYEVIYTCTDDFGNSVSATQTVTVIDTDNPIVNAPTDTTIEATGQLTLVTSGEIGTTIDNAIGIGTATATDSVDGVLAPTLDVSEDGFAVGEHTVTWSAVDRSGNTGSATQNVTIVDSTSPTVVAPADVVLDATGLLTMVSTETLGTATATDSVDDNPTITNDNPSDGFAVGEHTVTWSAVDHSGNVGTATQTVTIQDNTAPEIVLTSSSSTSSSNVSVLLNGDFTYSDTSCMDDTKDGEFAATRSGDQVDTSTVGVYEVIYTCTDNFGNSVSATQTVTVIDTDNPIVNAPADATIEATGQLTLVTSGEIGTIIDNAIGIGTATAIDSVDGVLTPVLTESSLELGKHIVTWTVTDSSGNQGTATQTVTIEDTTSPIVDAPADVVLVSTAPLTIVPPETLGTATATDSVDDNLTITNDYPSDGFAVGEHTVTWSAVDHSGNVGTATQNVKITDGTLPIIVTPTDVVLEATGPLTIVSLETLGAATATDDMDDNPTITNDNPSDGFGVGNHTVTWSAEDNSGNIGIATQNVNITDTTPPTVVTPTDVVLEATAPLTISDIGTATATDLVDDNPTITNDYPSDGFAVGNHTVTWSAADSYGNIGSATQNVNITDTTPPTIDVPSATSVEATGKFTQVTSENTGVATASDLVDGVLTPVLTESSLELGEHIVTWTVTDSSGNQGTATQTVTIEDTTPPTVTAPSDITREATGPLTPIKPGDAIATDLVDDTLKITYEKPPEKFSVGVHTITYIAVDDYENEGSATQTITVQDTIAPTITVNTSHREREIGENWNDKGARCVDIVDEKFTVYGTYYLVDGGSETLVDTIETDAAKTYSIKYVCIDTAGNESGTETITLQIVAKEKK